MSWQAYVDSSLVASGHVDKGAIISVAGDSVWAASAGFTIKPEEMKALAAILSKTGSAGDKAYSEGVHVAGEKYVVTAIDTDAGIISVRKGKLGVIVAKTKQAIIVGHYGETSQPGNARATVEALGDYLRKLGY